MILKLLTYINRLTTKILLKRYGVNTDYNRAGAQRRKKHNGFQVSEHALLRYYERLEGYNPENVMSTITKRLVVKQGVNKQVTGDMQVVCKGNVVLTVYPNDYGVGNKIKGL